MPDEPQSSQQPQLPGDPLFQVKCCIINCPASMLLRGLRNVYEARCFLIESYWADLVITLDSGQRQQRWLCPRCAKMYGAQIPKSGPNQGG